MLARKPPLILVLPLCATMLLGCTQISRVKDNVQVTRQLARTVLKKKHPEVCEDFCLETIAKEVDWLEHHIETYGSVVTKQPDVWGESRLTKYRHDVEKQLAKEIVNFKATLQGSLSRADTSSLAMALAVDSIEGEGGSASSSAAVNLIGDDGLVKKVDVASKNAIAGNSVKYKGQGEEGELNITLEPTIHLDQMKRYLDHLNELRRINNGDDTVDSPGYALHLVRLPISVLPGHRTRRGYGAEITFTATPVLGDDLLPTTFRDLVINDLEDRLALPVANILNGLTREQLALIARKQRWGKRQNAVPVNSLSYENEYSGESYTQPYTFVDHEADDIQLNELQQTWRLSESGASGGRRARFGFPTSHLHQVYGRFGFNAVVKAAAHLRESQVAKAGEPGQVVHLTDVRKFLRAELEAAFEFLSTPSNQHLWDTYCNDELATYIKNRQIETVSVWRNDYFDRDLVQNDYNIKHWATTSLGWAIIAESSLLQQRLRKEIPELYSKKGLGHVDAQAMTFVGPNPSPEARQIFNEYVSNRWPIQVFALDPVSQDQNIADEFSRRRELQLAMAVAVARGNMNASSAMSFARRLETDIRTIALNKTHVAFSHGNDTFGWRFFPRVQTPPTGTNLQAFAETLGGGPSPDQDLRDRQLEPGMRECTALIVMPSFVSYAKFESRGNWFGITNPRKKELTLHETLRLGKASQSIRTKLGSTTDACCYRSTDLSQVHSVVEQLDRRLPLQSMTVQIPYENTMGGFEMFNSGVSDLSPQLDGWYGAPGVVTANCGSVCDSCESTKNSDGCDCQGTTIFLVGDNFSVQDTKVIAGGKCISDIELLSRHVLQVTVPLSANMISYQDTHFEEDCVFRQFVDVHVVTPYGVSDHLLIPVHKHHETPPKVKSAEEEREKAEEKRQKAEKKRADAESKREKAEKERVEAEAKR